MGMPLANCANTMQVRQSPLPASESATLPSCATKLEQYRENIHAQYIPGLRPSCIYPHMWRQLKTVVVTTQSLHNCSMTLAYGRIAFTHTCGSNSGLLWSLPSPYISYMHLACGRAAFIHSCGSNSGLLWSLSSP